MPTPAPSSDGDLLSAFATARDDAAFSILVRRHWMLVISVCRRITGSHADAEDAAQAVFVVLAKKATTLVGRTSLAGWLHLTAHHVSMRVHAAMRVRREREFDVATVHVESSHIELPSNLDEAIAALPERYRLPLLIHHVEGHSHAEGAALLGWKIGTFAGRLSRARMQLRRDLGNVQWSLLIPPMLSPDPTAAVVRIALSPVSTLPPRIAALATEKTWVSPLSLPLPIVSIIGCLMITVIVVVPIAHSWRRTPTGSTIPPLVAAVSPETAVQEFLAENPDVTGQGHTDSVHWITLGEPPAGLPAFLRFRSRFCAVDGGKLGSRVILRVNADQVERFDAGSSRRWDEVIGTECLLVPPGDTPERRAHVQYLIEVIASVLGSQVGITEPIRDTASDIAAETGGWKATTTVRDAVDGRGFTIGIGFDTIGPAFGGISQWNYEAIGMPMQSMRIDSRPSVNAHSIPLEPILPHARD